MYIIIQIGITPYYIIEKVDVPTTNICNLIISDEWINIFQASTLPLT